MNPPQRILMTADTVGGVWTYALVLAEALRPYGIRVALATMGAPLSDAQRAAAADLANVEVHESDYRLEWMDDPWEDVEAAGAWLRELEVQVQPDLVHLNGFAHGALAWQAPVLMVGHSCVYSWFAAVEDEAPPGQWKRYRRAVTRGLRQADAVTAPTAAMLDALERHYGAFTRAGIVYNGRQAARFRPRAKAPFVLTAGRLWDEAKSTAALEAVASHLPWPVYVAGEDRPPDGERVQFEHVTPLGALTPAALARRMGRASIFALPARYEPFGLSALEAGLAGCTLVLGDIPSLREVWGDAALFVPPEDAAALEAALRRLIEDAALRERMAARARRRALTYTPRRMARGYLGLYVDLLRRPAPLSPAAAPT